MVNHLYRYELVDNQLINPKLLLILPARSPISNRESNVKQGVVKVYDQLKIMPGGKDMVVKSIQMHDDPVDESRVY